MLHNFAGYNNSSLAFRALQPARHCLPCRQSMEKSVGVFGLTLKGHAFGFISSVSYLKHQSPCVLAEWAKNRYRSWLVGVPATILQDRVIRTLPDVCPHGAQAQIIWHSLHSSMSKEMAKNLDKTARFVGAHSPCDCGLHVLVQSHHPVPKPDVSSCSLTLPMHDTSCV